MAFLIGVGASDLPATTSSTKFTSTFATVDFLKLPLSSPNTPLSSNESRACCLNCASACSLEVASMVRPRFCLSSYTLSFTLLSLDLVVVTYCDFTVIVPLTKYVLFLPLDSLPVADSLVL